MAMLKNCVFHSSEVCSHAKHAVYTGLVLNTLLYGSESWCLPEYLIARLHRFHMDQARCPTEAWITPSGLRRRCRGGVIGDSLNRL